MHSSRLAEQHKIRDGAAKFLEVFQAAQVGDEDGGASTDASSDGQGALVSQVRSELNASQRSIARLERKITSLSGARSALVSD